MTKLERSSVAAVAGRLLPVVSRTRARAQIKTKAEEYTQVGRVLIRTQVVQAGVAVLRYHHIPLQDLALAPLLIMLEGQ